MSESRLTDLEVKFMHVEKLCEQLNDVVVEQQAQIDRMAREVATLRDALDIVRNDDSP
jgi:SlyX protein